MKRILAAMLSLCLLALCACGQPAPTHTTVQTTATTTTQAPTTQPIEYPSSYKDAPAAYKLVLDDLYALKQWLWNGNVDWRMVDYDKIDEFSYANDIFGAWTQDPVDGYAVKDINNDGIQELLLFQAPSSDALNLRSLFTLSDGQPVCLGFYGPRHWGGIAVDGTVYYGGSGSAASGRIETYRLKPHAATLTLVAGHDYDYWPPEEVDTYYKLVDGERVIVDEKAYNAIAKQYADPEKNPMKFDYIPIEQ